MCNRFEKRIPLTQLSVDFQQKLLFWANGFQTFAFLDSNQFPQKYSSFQALLAVGTQSSLESNYPNAFQKLKDYYNSTQDYIFGFLSYDLKNDIENLSSNNFDGLHFPELFFFQPLKIFIFHEKEVCLLYHSMVQNEWENDINSIEKQDITCNSFHSKINIQSRINQTHYFEKFNELQKFIHRGDTYETNFCIEFYAENASIYPLELFEKLNKKAEAPFSVFFRHKYDYLLSTSPERFVRKEGTKIISQPIKGTAKRGKTQAEDEQIKLDLENNPKERSENIMIVDLVRNDLSITASKGSVMVEELCKVYSFPTVHQLVSTIISNVTQDTHPVEVIKKLFPMGSMTGAPKISTMKIIEKLEETKRGLYSGAFGYFSPSGDFDFNVVIRSVLYNEKLQYLSFSVGGAITALSEVENEYEECLLKAFNIKNTLENLST